jgi:predicted kinase
MPTDMPVLIVFSGLPGSGKSMIARALARDLGGVWLRIDAIEQAIRASGIVTGSLDDAGYRAAYALAEDNLRLGRDVIADCVNPWMLTRDAWRATGLRAGARVVEIETVCPNPREHRRRVETRTNDVPGMILPDWAAVTTRDYHAWDRDVVTIDTAENTIATCIERIRAAIAQACEEPCASGAAPSTPAG